MTRSFRRMTFSLCNEDESERLNELRLSRLAPDGTCVERRTPACQFMGMNSLHRGVLLLGILVVQPLVYVANTAELGAWPCGRRKVLLICRHVDFLGRLF